MSFFKEPSAKRVKPSYDDDEDLSLDLVDLFGESPKLPVDTYILEEKKVVEIIPNDKPVKVVIPPDVYSDLKVFYDGVGELRCLATNFTLRNPEYKFRRGDPAKMTISLFFQDHKLSRTYIYQMYHTLDEFIDYIKSIYNPSRPVTKIQSSGIVNRGMQYSPEMADKMRKALFERSEFKYQPFNDSIRNVVECTKHSLYDEDGNSLTHHFEQYILRLREVAPDNMFIFGCYLYMALHEDKQPFDEYWSDNETETVQFSDFEWLLFPIWNGLHAALLVYNTVNNCWYAIDPYFTTSDIGEVYDRYTSLYCHAFNLTNVLSGLGIFDLEVTMEFKYIKSVYNQNDSYTCERWCLFSIEAIIAYCTISRSLSDLKFDLVQLFELESNSVRVPGLTSITNAYNVIPSPIDVKHFLVHRYLRDDSVVRNITTSGTLSIYIDYDSSSDEESVPEELEPIELLPPSKDEDAGIHTGNDEEMREIFNSFAF